ncbi:hypothetical protein ABT142_18795 [Streptomyces sp. NPDC001857]|uniref:hypothetical protein n=1 Tax=unclassified Streptomyces TaxID=2593676 RepID=UPI00332EC978
MLEASGERAVGLGGSARNVATGDGATQIDMQIEQATVLPAEAFAPVGDLPERLLRVPSPTGLFVGGERELRLLDEAFDASGARPPSSTASAASASNEPPTTQRSSSERLDR